MSKGRLSFRLFVGSMFLHSCGEEVHRSEEALGNRPSSVVVASLGLQDGGKISDGSDIVQTYEDGVSAFEPTPVPIALPTEAGVKDNIVANAPCSMPDGYPSHPRESIQCSGYLSLSIPTDYLTIYYNSGRRDRSWGIDGITHSLRYKIEITPTHAFYFTPTERMRLVPVTGTLSSATQFKFANPMYGKDTIFEKEGRNFYQRSSGTTLTFHNTYDAAYVLRSVENLVSRTDINYANSSEKLASISFIDRTAQNTSKTIDVVINGNPVATQILLRDSTQTDKDYIIQFRNGFISTITREQTNLNSYFQIGSNKVGRRYPVAYVMREGSRPVRAMFFGFDRNGRVLFQQNGEESLAFDYGGSTHPNAGHVKITNGYGFARTTRYGVFGSSVLPVESTSPYGLIKNEYETRFPFRMTRSFDPRFGWTTISRTENAVTMTFPDKSWQTIGSLTENSLYAEDSLGQRTDVTQTVTANRLQLTMETKQGKGKQSREMTLQTDGLTFKDAAYSGTTSIAKSRSVIGFRIGVKDLNYTDQVHGSRVIAEKTDEGEVVSRYQNAIANIASLRVEVAGSVREASSSTRIYGVLASQTAVKATDIGTTFSQLSLNVRAIGDDGSSIEYRKDGRVIERRWIEGIGEPEGNENSIAGYRLAGAPASQSAAVRSAVTQRDIQDSDVDAMVYCPDILAQRRTVTGPRSSVGSVRQNYCKASPQTSLVCIFDPQTNDCAKFSIDMALPNGWEIDGQDLAASRRCDHFDDCRRKFGPPQITTTTDAPNPPTVSSTKPTIKTSTTKRPTTTMTISTTTTTAPTTVTSTTLPSACCYGKIDTGGPIQCWIQIIGGMSACEPGTFDDIDGVDRCDSACKVREMKK